MFLAVLPQSLYLNYPGRLASLTSPGFFFFTPQQKDTSCIGRVNHQQCRTGTTAYWAMGILTRRASTRAIGKVRELEGTAFISSPKMAALCDAACANDRRPTDE